MSTLRTGQRPERHHEKHLHGWQAPNASTRTPACSSPDEVKAADRPSASVPAVRSLTNALSGSLRPSRPVGKTTASTRVQRQASVGCSARRGQDRPVSPDVARRRPTTGRRPTACQWRRRRGQASASPQDGARGFSTTGRPLCKRGTWPSGSGSTRRTDGSRSGVPASTGPGAAGIWESRTPQARRNAGHGNSAPVIASGRSGSWNSSGCSCSSAGHLQPTTKRLERVRAQQLQAVLQPKEKVMPKTPWVGLAALLAMFVLPYLPTWLFEGPRAVKHWPRRHVCGDCGAPWTSEHMCAIQRTSTQPPPLRGELGRPGSLRELERPPR
jgi:hypothetical protein